MSDESVCGDPDADGFALTPQQQAALESDHNIAITAGAGTGKTTTLTERYRSLLAEDESIRPTEILTLTFTKDATNEMRDQIRDVVDEELSAATADQYDRWREVKDDLGDAYIHTIHGFCSRILREFSVEAGVHPEFETLDEGEADTIIDEAIATVLDWYGGTESSHATEYREPLAPASAVDGPGEVQAAIRTLTQVYSRSDLETTLSGLFAERPDSVTWANRCAQQTTEAYLTWMADHIDIPITRDEADELFETETVQSAVDDILQLQTVELGFTPADDDGAALLEELTDILLTAKPHHSDGDSIDRQRFLLTIAEAVTTAAGEWTSQAWRYAGSGSRWGDHGLTDERSKFKSAVDSIGERIAPESRELGYDPIVARNEAEQTIALARVFQYVRAEYKELKQRRNVLDYADLIERATRFLDTTESARQTLRDQFAYIMIDEVQDTDPRQWELIKLLSGDDSERFDGQNVFLVGDEKQSIYRFRDADVTRFNKARNRLLADNPPTVTAQNGGDLELSGNFRTLEETLSVINELFENVLQPAESDPTAEESEATSPEYQSYEAKPQSLSACRAGGTDLQGSVEYLVVPDDNEADAALGLAESWYTEEPFVSRAEREATAIAARLTQLFGEQQVYDEDKDEYRDARPEDVALLFQSSRRLAEFERAFEAAAIPYTNLASSGFYDTPEIRPLINLFRVLEDPTADIPLYGVLRSPLFGFTDGTLANAREPERSLWASLSTASPALQTARNRIETWRTTVGLADTPDIHHWSALLSDIIDQTGYLISVGADERSQQAVANVEQFRAQVRNWEEARARSISALIDRIERDRERDTDPSEASIPGEIEGVQLRTIHSAKGLEFPIVCLPELTREFNLQSSLNSAHFEQLSGEPMIGMKAPAQEIAYETTNSSAYRAVREAYRRRERAEKRRVLYVAATRTRDHLIFSGTHGVDAETASGLDDAGAWDTARSWQDWLQPILLEKQGLVEALAGARSVECQIEDANYTIRRPTPPGDWTPDSTDETVPSDIEIPEPADASLQRRLSASNFRDELVDVASRPAILQASENRSHERDPSVDDTRAIEALGNNVVGSVVHRLCELEPPETEWETVIQRLVDTPSVIEGPVLEAITAHAEAGIDGLRQLEAGHEIQSRHTEFSVALELETLAVRGDIDHLSVTETGYLVVDYKTSDLSSQSLKQLTERYLLQLVVYAGALLQADKSATEFKIALVFTDTGVCCARTLSRDDVHELLEWAEDTISG